MFTQLGVTKLEGNNSSDGRVVRAFTPGAVDVGLLLTQVKPMTLKLVFTVSLLDIQHQRYSVENKPTSCAIGKGT